MNLLVIAKPKKKYKAGKFVIKTEKEDVEPSNQIRVLGCEINSRLSDYMNIAKVINSIKAVIASAARF